MIDIPKIELKKTEENSEIDFLKIHKESFVDLRKQLKPQPVALSIGEDEYKGNKYPIAFGSYGDFSCIVGASKSRKTWLKSIFEAVYLKGSLYERAPQIKAYNNKDKLLISIDTEQSDYHTQLVAKRVEELIKGHNHLYRTHSLRSCSTYERLQYIDWLFYESEYRGNIGYMTIDGIADLNDDVNDLKAGNHITGKLLKWTKDEHCHITAVLHKNFGTMKPTGHLGSAIMKKAETVAFVEKEGDFSNVTAHEYTRNKEFKPFTFGVDRDWLPYLTDYCEPINNNKTPF